jgi:hypothetical protein
MRPLVDRSHPEISVRRQCELLGVNRSGLYYEPVGESEENLLLMRLLDVLVAASEGATLEGPNRTTTPSRGGSLQKRYLLWDARGPNRRPRARDGNSPHPLSLSARGGNGCCHYLARV